MEQVAPERPAERPFRVVISGSYGGVNLGDEAILQAILAQLRATVPVETTVFTRDVQDTLSRHRVDRALANRDLSRDEAREEVGRHDLLILGGGGILFDAEADLYLREVALAHEVGVPVAVYAVSAGPLQEARARRLVREALASAALVTVRDRQAKRLLEDLGLRHEIVLTADPAFLLEPEPLPPDALKCEGIDSGRPLVGFSVREPGPAAPDLDVERYHDLLANAADFVVDRLDAEVVFVPMERRNRDLQYSHAVVARMRCAQRAVVLKQEYTAGQLLTLVGHLSFAIGMRLHFLIFAAVQGVPCIPLPYAPKVAGLAQELQLVFAAGQGMSSGQLIASIDRSWDNRSLLVERIARARPGLQERARTTNALVADLLISGLRADSR